MQMTGLNSSSKNDLEEFRTYILVERNFQNTLPERTVQTLWIIFCGSETPVVRM